MRLSARIPLSSVRAHARAMLSDELSQLSLLRVSHVLAERDHVRPENGEIRYFRGTAVEARERNDDDDLDDERARPSVLRERDRDSDHRECFFNSNSQTRVGSSFTVGGLMVSSQPDGPLVPPPMGSFLWGLVSPSRKAASRCAWELSGWTPVSPAMLEFRRMVLNGHASSVRATRDRLRLNGSFGRDHLFVLERMVLHNDFELFVIRHIQDTSNSAELLAEFDPGKVDFVRSLSMGSANSTVLCMARALADPDMLTEWNELKRLVEDSLGPAQPVPLAFGPSSPVPLALGPSSPAYCPSSPPPAFVPSSPSYVPSSPPPAFGPSSPRNE